MSKNILNANCGVWRVYYEQKTSSIVIYKPFKEGRGDVTIREVMMLAYRSAHAKQFLRIL